MPVRPTAEPKTGMIVALTFFILATLGLGTSTYFGFAEQENLRKAKKEADSKESTASNLAKYYKFQSMLYWTYISQANPVGLEELEQLKDDWKDGTAGWASSQKDVDEVKNRIRKLETQKFKDAKDQDQTFVFDKTLKRPRITFEDVDAAHNARNKALYDQYVSAMKAKKDAEDKLKERTDELANTRTDFTKKFEDEKKRLDDDLAAYKVELRKFVDESKKRSDEYTKQLADMETKKRDLEKSIAERKKELDKLLELVKDQKDTIVELRLKGKEPEPNVRTDWKVMSIDRTGKTVYINLGSTDQVKAQDTFAIHGFSADGKVLPKSKGSLEVVNVVGDHLSQCRVIEVRDPGKDPIIQGDIVYNPTWDPTRKKHIALAGIIDLSGEGRNQIAEFMRQLEKNNFVIDAYMDPKDLTVKGPGMSAKTEFLILGDGLDPTSPDARGRDKDIGDRVDKTITQMLKQAELYGVEKIYIRKYLEQTGARVPKGYLDGKANPLATYRLPGSSGGTEKPKETPMPPKDAPKQP